MTNGIRNGLLALGLLAMGGSGATVEASPFVAQPALVQAIAPATAGGWYRAGWRGCCGWGRYYYGRPVIYSGYRPYYRTWVARPTYYATSWSTGYSPYNVSTWPAYTAPVTVAPVYTAPVYPARVYAPVYAAAYRVPVYRAPVYTVAPYGVYGGYYGGGFYGVGYSAYAGVPYTGFYGAYRYPLYSPYQSWYGIW